MTMCLLGARNKTESQLKNLLNYDILPKGYNPNEANAQLFAYFAQFRDDNLTLSIANKLYPKQGLTIKNEFLKLVQTLFNSYLHPVVFSNPSFTINLINSWVNSQTNNKIQNALTTDMIDDNTVMILVNAIYFKGNWLHNFDKNLTKKEKFHMEDGFYKKIRMMRLTNQFLKLRQNPAGLNITVCDFEFVGSSMSLSIILPNENVKLSEIEKVLDYEKFQAIFNEQPVRTRVNVTLPRLKLEDEFEVGPFFFLLK